MTPKAEEATINGNCDYEPLFAQLNALDKEYCVGFEDDENAPAGRDGDWSAHADFHVETHPETGEIIVVYHVVVQSDSGKFIDTFGSAVLLVEDEKDPRLPYGLMDEWWTMHDDPRTVQENRDAERASVRWMQDLEFAIRAERLGLDRVDPE